MRMSGALRRLWALACLAAALLRCTSLASEDTCEAAHRRVEALQWQAHLPFARFLSQREAPVVLRGAVVEAWKARRSWDTRRIAEAAARQGERLGGLYRRRGSAVFGPYYDATRPMHQLEAVRGASPYEDNVSIPVDEVYAKLTAEGPGADEFYMLSQNPSAISPLLWDDIQPMEEFISLSDRYSVNVWLGQPGATTPCHYDGYANMYAHLYGSKRFYLLPSARWKEAYIYPLLHPSYGQCQVNLTAPDQQLYTAAKPLHQYEDALVVDLQPGDLLYLPPFWLHEVVTNSPSVSVNFWTDIQETKISEAVMQEPIPGLQIAAFSKVTAELLPLWPDSSTRLTLSGLAKPPARVLLASHLLLSTLALAVNFDTQRLRRIIHDVAVFRYGPLVGDAHVLKGLQETDRRMIADTLCSQVHEHLKEYDLPAKRVHTHAQGVLLRRLSGLGADSMLVDHVAAYQNRVLPGLTELANHKLAEDIWLANYVELVALRALGVAHASVFIQAIYACTLR